LFKEDIEPEKLIEYLLASANFPIYKTQNIDGKHFWDGGLYDNMPFNPLIGRGYTHLIVVDINGMGQTRKMENADKVYLNMISCSEDLGGTFEFNPGRIRHNMVLGYLDTLKAFHRLFGNYFFFRRPAFNDLLMRFDLETIHGLEKAGKLFAFFIIPLPLIGFVIYSLVTEKMELNQALMAGGFISFVFLVCTLISAIKSRASKSYEAVVTDKKQRERAEHSNDDNTSYYTQYITYAKTDDGKKKKIVETSRGIVSAYNYLPIGARFKYHPQFAFPYELYDKANAPYIVCVACGTHNSPTDDRCSRCNVPLLK
ncbi:MAG: patatin-like phospholipase family protein, partial [Eubacterium sp.]|nr:patatin-like phospholipase family protein [Eubacterium sp.]